MEFIKTCMDCGKEFEEKKLNNDTISCPKCGSGDIAQVSEAYYDEIKLENCFELYHEDKVACMCDGDKKQVIFVEE